MHGGSGSDVEAHYINQNQVRTKETASRRVVSIMYDFQITTIFLFLIRSLIPKFKPPLLQPQRAMLQQLQWRQQQFWRNQAVKW